MIIQCRQCRTKFRFDDALMEGDGVWMRCSHCQHVFFQDNPQAIKPGMEPMSNDERAAAIDAVAGQRTKTPSTEDSDISGGDEDVAHFIDDVMKTEKILNKESIMEIEKPANDEIPEDENALTDELLEDNEADKHKKRKSSSKGWGKVLKIFLWTILVIVVIPAIVYFFVFPEMGDRLIKIANQYFDIGIKETASPEIVTGQVKLQDIRQRILNNYILGKVRVVEGTAVNQADYAISRIVIKGEIVDAYAVVLGERASYAGNVLTDEELTTLSEDEILKRLSQPEGRGNSNDKIVPNGQIPFMIVFAREPTGVIKTTVTTIGAEHLLSN
jgi:predicted Zn finger-like uncharacterized protein